MAGQGEDWKSTGWRTADRSRSGGMLGRGEARLGVVVQGMARRGKGTSVQWWRSAIVKAWQGKAWLGRARLGVARRGLVRQG